MTPMAITSAQLREAREAVAFIWQGQAGYFQVAYTEKKSDFFQNIDDALDALPQSRYFCPLTRHTRRGRKVDVCSTGNVLWVDIDSPLALAAIDSKLRPLGIAPSVIVCSGRGYWAYLKLTQHIPCDEIEQLNKRLRALLDGDKRSCERSRKARTPGTINQKQGKPAKPAYVAELRKTLFDPAYLDQKLPLLSQLQPVVVRTTIPATTPFQLTSQQAGQRPLLPTFSPRLRNYIDGRYILKPGESRSELEQSIIYRLACCAFTDEQIIEALDYYGLPKHTEERRRRGSYGWTRTSIKNARIEMQQRGVTPSPSNGVYLCNQSARHAIHLNPWELLKSINGQYAAELEQEWQTKVGCSAHAVRRNLQRLYRRKLLQKERRGRRVHYTRTARGDELVRTRRRVLLPRYKDLK